MLTFQGVEDREMRGEIFLEHMRCLAKLAEHAAVLGPKYPELEAKLQGMPVELSNRMAVCGGRAISNRMTGHSLIKMNYRLHKMHPAELVETYAHELMHVVAFQLYGSNEGHGPRWKALMTLIGRKNERCHKMDVAALRREPVRHMYICAAVNCDRVYRVTTHKHNRLQQHIHAYRCRCGGGLMYKGEK